MTANITNVTVLNQVDLSALEENISILGANVEITNYLITYIIIAYFLLLFFRNVSRVYGATRGKKK